MTEDSTIPTTELPTYGSKPTRPGMYLGLFHGRSRPREAMNDWGFKATLNKSPWYGVCMFSATAAGT